MNVDSVMQNEPATESTKSSVGASAKDLSGFLSHRLSSEPNAVFENVIPDKARPGAAEPGAASNISKTNSQETTGAPTLIRVKNDDTWIRVAFYNVGLQQSDLNCDKKSAEIRCQALAHDIAEAFTRHSLDLLCLCTLGDPEIGLEGKMNLRCNTQKILLEMILGMVSMDRQPHVEVELISGQYPSYAAMKRRGSQPTVENVTLHRRLDKRALEFDRFEERSDRAMLTLNCIWMGQPIRITCCHCPHYRDDPWNTKTQAAVLPNVFKHAGLVPFDHWSNDGAESLAWILGGNLNLGQLTIVNGMKQFQPHGGGERLVQMIEAGGLLKHHGDWAMAQHVRAFQTASLIGHDYGGISDAHNMVVVLAQLYAKEKLDSASEPIGPTAFGASASLGPTAFGAS